MTEEKDDEQIGGEAARAPGAAPSPESAEEAPREGRRDFGVHAAAAVGAATLGAVGLGAGFLWPRRKEDKTAVYACLVQEIRPGRVKEVRSPRGDSIFITRLGESEGAEDILAIGTTCSHLGCRVFYRPDDEEHRRFHCPCHQGFFDARGYPTAGPPERPLDRYEVEVRGRLLFLKYENV